MIVGRDGTTAVFNLPTSHGLPRTAGPQHTIKKCRDPRAAPRGRPVTSPGQQGIVNLVGRVASAAKKFFRELLKGLRYVPRVIVTDKLGSYQVAHRAMAASAEHRRSKYLNNRAENSHQPTRVRERTMKCFHSAGQAQRFCSAHGVISSDFRPGRHLMSGTEWRTEMSQRFTTWNEVTGIAIAA
jgi:hypothetical protein